MTKIPGEIPYIIPCTGAWWHKFSWRTIHISENAKTICATPVRGILNQLKRANVKGILIAKLRERRDKGIFASRERLWKRRMFIVTDEESEEK